MDMNRILSVLKSKWWVFAIIIIALMGSWLRSFPARFGEFQGLDEFYIYRMAEYVLNHDLQLPEVDLMRHHPFGAHPRTDDPPVPFYLPVLSFLFIKAVGLNALFELSNIPYTFFNFAMLWPAIIGFFTMPAIYLIGKELFDKKTGIIAAFFVATTPAFITRTSAGLFEKECIAGVFMILAVYFFITAYRRNSWKHAVLGGINMAILHLGWGGVQYFFLLFATFTLIMLLLNRFSMNLLKAYSGTILLGLVFVRFFTPLQDIFSATSMFSLGMLALVYIRFLVGRFNLIKKEKIAYFAPALVVVTIAGFLIGTMFSDFLYGLLEGLIKAVFIQTSVAGSTVAEQAPGTWDDVVRVTSNIYIGGNYGVFQWFVDAFVRPTAGLFHMYLLMIAGTIVLVFKMGREFLDMLKKKTSFLSLGSATDPKKLLHIEMLGFLLLWNITSIWGVFGFIRLIFLVGPPMSILAAVFVTTLINRYRMHFPLWRDAKNIVKRILFYLPLAIILLLMAASNLASGYTFSMSLGPIFNSYWAESMNFLKNDTPENSNILSWWDFGYWFQTRGNRPSVSDGGGVGPRYDIAIWYMDKPLNFSGYNKWLYERYGVDYILQDYSLPGKYGAISKIGSQGARVDGFIQFNGQPSNVYPKGNTTIYEYTAGPYALWIPVVGNNIAGSAILLVSQNGQIYSKAYVNDFCSPVGIMKVGDSQPAIEGSCFAITGYGIFFIPAEVRDTIFVSLQFMHGAGLPVKQVFDNGLIQIFELLYPPEYADLVTVPGALIVPPAIPENQTAAGNQTAPLEDNGAAGEQFLGDIL